MDLRVRTPQNSLLTACHGLSSLVLMVCLWCVSWTEAQDTAAPPESPPAAQAAAQQEVRLQAERVLAEAKGRIAREEKRLQQLQKRETELLASSQRADKEVGEIMQRKTALVQSINDLESQSQRLEDTIASLKHKVAAQQAALQRRIVALYKTQRRISSLNYLLSAGSATDLLKRSRALVRVGDADRRRLEQLAASVAALEDEKAALDEVKSRRERSLGDLKIVEDDLSKKKYEQASLLDEVKQQRVLQEKSISKLKHDANKLEQALASVMGGDEPPPKLEGPAPEEPEEKTQTALITPPPKPEPAPPPGPERVTPYQGAGLEPLKGKLISPVDGSVIQRFGSRQKQEFSDVIISKGWEYQTTSQSKVRAVAPGKVVLHNTLPGFGNVLIVDHGSRHYTLYGRLSSALIQVGDVVNSGDVIGIVSNADAKGRTFYFELRVRGKAVDPFNYFRSKPKFIES